MFPAVGSINYHRATTIPAFLRALRPAIAFTWLHDSTSSTFQTCPLPLASLLLFFSPWQ
jgi:hypothetical protein